MFGINIKSCTKINTGWSKSHAPEQKMNFTTKASGNELIFLLIIEACSSFISIKTSLERFSVKYIVFLSIFEKMTFF